MNWAVIGGLILGGSVLLLVALLAVRLLRYRNLPVPEPIQQTDGEELAAPGEEFAIQRYEPMARLIAAEDLAFLSSLKGYRPEIGKKLRRERSRIFRAYLIELAEDFHRLHSKARALVAESPEVHSELVGILIGQQVKFMRSMAWIELRLLIPQQRLPHIDVAGLLASVDTMRLDLARITAH